MEHQGQTYRGSYQVTGKLLTVVRAYGTKSTQVGGSPPETLAKMLLGELVRAHQT